MVKMPFGQHKGKDIEYIALCDPGYFLWLETIDLRSPAKDEVKRVGAKYRDDLDSYESDLRDAASEYMATDWGDKS